MASSPWPTTNGPVRLNAVPGDVVIYLWPANRIEVVDAVTRERVALVNDLRCAYAVAARKRGAVWTVTLNHRGDVVGTPTRILSRTAVERMTHARP